MANVQIRPSKSFKLPWHLRRRVNILQGNLVYIDDASPTLKACLINNYESLISQIIVWRDKKEHKLTIDASSWRCKCGRHHMPTTIEIHHCEVAHVIVRTTSDHTSGICTPLTELWRIDTPPRQAAALTLPSFSEKAQQHMEETRRRLPDRRFDHYASRILSHSIDEESGEAIWLLVEHLANTVVELRDNVPVWVKGEFRFTNWHMTVDTPPHIVHEETLICTREQCPFKPM